MGLVIFLIFLCTALWALKYLYPQTLRGKITIDGSTYACQIGDRIEGGWDVGEEVSPTFRGIEIQLDKALPHMYLDGNSHERLSGPRLYITKKNRVSLEGDFDKYFELYVADGYASLALSIITPEVMQTIIDADANYDVEIKDAKLRLISRVRVFRHPQRRQALIDALKPLLKEINDRLASWSLADQALAEKSHLDMKSDPAIKVGRHAFRLVWLLCIFIGVIFSGAWLIATDPSLLANGRISASGGARWIGVVVSMLFPFVVLYVFESFKQRYPKLYQSLSEKFRR